MMHASPRPPGKTHHAATTTTTPDPDRGNVCSAETGICWLQKAQGGRRRPTEGWSWFCPSKIEILVREGLLLWVWPSSPFGSCRSQEESRHLHPSPAEGQTLRRVKTLRPSLVEG